MALELPDDLTEDMEVLFINPYSPEDSARLRMTGGSDAELAALFKQVERYDPGLQKFEDKVAVVKTILGLGGYIAGDDLILLYGDRDALQKAHDSLKDEYTCFFDTVGDFLRFTEREDATVVIPAEKPTLH